MSRCCRAPASRVPAPVNGPAPARGLRALELDPSVLGIAGALLAVAVGFELASDGVFLRPRNLSNLAIQSSVVGIMAAGIEGQQRGILQGEHREGRQQRVPQRDLRLGPLVENPLQAGPHRAAQTIGGQMTARLGCGQRHGHIPVRNLSCEAVRRSDSLTDRLRPPKGSACAPPCLRNHDRKHPRFPDVIGSPGIAGVASTLNFWV